MAAVAESPAVPRTIPAPRLQAAPLLAGVNLASLAVALTLFVAIVWHYRDQTLEDSAADTRQIADLLGAQTEQVLASTGALLEQLDWIVSDRGWPASEADSGVHDRLAQLAKWAPDIAAIRLIDASGKVRAASAPVPLDASDRPSFTRLVAQSGAALAVAKAPGDPEAAFLVSRRVETVEGVFLGVVEVAVTPVYFDRFYEAASGELDPSAQLICPDGTLLLSRPGPRSGSAPRPQQTAAFMEHLTEPSGSFVGAGVDGVERLYAYRRIAGMPLFAVSGEGRNAVLAQWRSTVLLYAAFALPALSVLSLLGWLAYARSRQVDSAKQALRAANTGLEQRVAERTHELQRINAQLQESVDHKDLLLREVHHRVKNNLQIIGSLLALQAAKAGPEHRELHAQSLRRIKTMGLIHEQLDKDNPTRIAFGEYLRQLIANLAHSYGIDPNSIALELELAGVPLALETAIPLALVINEVLSNALKHGFRDGLPVAATVGLKREADAMVLTIADEGVGFDPASPPAGRGIGLDLVRALSGQLGGTAEYVPQGRGTLFRLTFPLPS